MKNIQNFIRRYCNLVGHTEDELLSDEFLYNSSFYLLPTGEYLNCECDEYGTRGDDHRIVFGATKLDPYISKNAWVKLQNNYKLIRIIPEVPCLILTKHQRLTKEQKLQIEILINNGFTVERYI